MEEAPPLHKNARSQCQSQCQCQCQLQVDYIEIPGTTHHCWRPSPAFNLQYIKLGKMTTKDPLQHRTASQVFYLVYEFISLHVRDKHFPRTHPSIEMGNAARPESPEHDEPTSLRNFEEPLSPLIESLSPIQKRKYNPRASRNCRKRSKQTSIENPALDSTDPTLTINRTQHNNENGGKNNNHWGWGGVRRVRPSLHHPKNQCHTTRHRQHHE